jgi:hypothetical protein
MQIPRQSLAIECTPISEIEKICLTSETSLKTPAEVISIVSEARSLEKFEEYQGKRRSEVVCCKQYSQKPAEYLYECNHNNPNYLSHVHTEDLEVKEFWFMHGESFYYAGMKHSKEGAFNQIDYAVVEVRRTLKREIELHLNHGKLFYTKSGLFGVNVSSFYQFDFEVFKLDSATYPLDQIKSSFRNIEHPVA